MNTSIVLVAAFTFFDLAQVFFYEDIASTDRSQYRKMRSITRTRTRKIYGTCRVVSQ